MEAASLGCENKTNEQVTEIKTGTNGKNFQILTKGWHYDADALILANGSRASSVSGSDGSGYMLAESFHHRIVPVYPALTALKCKGSSFKAWAGVRTEGEISLFTDGKFCKSEHGELQLTDTESPESQCFSSALMQYVQSEKDIKQSSALISCRSCQKKN